MHKDSTQFARSAFLLLVFSFCSAVASADDATPTTNPRLSDDNFTKTVTDTYNAVTESLDKKTLDANDKTALKGHAELLKQGAAILEKKIADAQSKIRDLDADKSAPVMSDEDLPQRDHADVQTTAAQVKLAAAVLLLQTQRAGMLTKQTEIATRLAREPQTAATSNKPAADLKLAPSPLAPLKEEEKMRQGLAALGTLIKGVQTISKPLVNVADSTGLTTAIEPLTNRVSESLKYRLNAQKEILDTRLTANDANGGIDRVASKGKTWTETLANIRNLGSVADPAAKIEFQFGSQDNGQKFRFTADGQGDLLNNYSVLQANSGGRDGSSVTSLSNAAGNLMTVNEVNYYGWSNLRAQTKGNNFEAFVGTADGNGSYRAAGSIGQPAVTQGSTAVFGAKPAERSLASDLTTNIVSSVAQKFGINVPTGDTNGTLYALKSSGTAPVHVGTDGKVQDGEAPSQVVTMANTALAAFRIAFKGSTTDAAPLVRRSNQTAGLAAREKGLLGDAELASPASTAVFTGAVKDPKAESAIIASLRGRVYAPDNNFRSDASTPTMQISPSTAAELATLTSYQGLYPTTVSPMLLNQSIHKPASNGRPVYEGLSPSALNELMRVTAAR